MESIKVLIVENELLISRDIALRLKGAGYQITEEVTTAAEALRSVEDQLPDIVIMDINLDGKKDGIKAAAEIKKNYQDQVQVIFLTDLDDDKTMQRAAEVKSTFLVKPFNERQVVASIQNSIHHASYALKPKPGDPKPQAESYYYLNDCLFIRVDGKHYKKMLLKDIAFIEADGAYAHIHTAKGEKCTYALNMNSVHSRLNHPSFVRVSRFNVVNLDHVDEINGNMLIVNKKEIMIGDTFRGDVKKVFPLLR